MPLLAPYLPQQRCLSGRFQHLGPLAILTSPPFFRYHRDKAGHISVLTHRDLSFAAPDSARRRPAQVWGHLKAVSAVLTDYRHGNFADETGKALSCSHELFLHCAAPCNKKWSLEALHAGEGISGEYLSITIFCMSQKSP